MRRRTRFWAIFTIILLAGTAAGYIYFTQFAAAKSAAAAEPELQTATARRGDLTIAATGAGTIIAATEIGLSFATGGTVSAVFVQVGDRVAAGDVLAQIDDTSARQALANAELQYAGAVMRTDGSATAAGISFNDISLAQAQLNLDQAAQNLAELQDWTPDPDAIALAEASLAAAQASYDAALGQSTAGASSITVANINLEQAERDMTDAQAAYDTAYDPARDWELNDARRGPALERERDSAANGLQRAGDNLTIAQANYSATVANSRNSSAASAYTGLVNAQQALTAAQTGPAAATITAAETALRQAELSMQQTQLNAEADALSLAQSQLNLETARANVANTVLIAPMNGVIMSTNAGVGEQTSGVFLTLADLDQPMLEVLLDETDLDNVVAGYEVDVFFDALPDDTFTGRIIQVDPQLVSSGGVTAIRTLVQLDSFALPQVLPVGLNATVDVIGGRAENAVLVPVEALRELSPDQYAVFVIEGGEPVLRLVEVGLLDFSFAEIISGLEAGEVVSTGIVATNG